MYHSTGIKHVLVSLSSAYMHREQKCEIKFINIACSAKIFAENEQKRSAWVASNKDDFS